MPKDLDIQFTSPDPALVGTAHEPRPQHAKSHHEQTLYATLHPRRLTRGIACPPAPKPKMRGKDKACAVFAWVARRSRTALFSAQRSKADNSILEFLLGTATAF